MMALLRKWQLRHGFVAGGLALMLGAMATLLACGEESTSRFSHHRAFLRFSPVAAAPVLSAAVHGVGEWCAITYDASHYVFTNAAQRTSRYPRTALDAYGTPTSIAGFVVGTPALPDLSGRQTVVAFDLVCPSCYQGAYVERRLSWNPSTPGTLVCGRCQRHYDLNNGGIVSVTKGDGQPNVGLFRYLATYSANSDVFVVQN
jgi:putative lipoprotein